jgi:hypothetical protein
MVAPDGWSVSCRNLAGHRCEINVLVSGDRVVLIAPPGETAVLTPLDVGRLRAALRDAVMNVSEPLEQLVGPDEEPSE